MLNNLRILALGLVAGAIVGPAAAGIVNTIPSGVDVSTLESFSEARGRVASNSWRQGLFAGDNPNSSNTSNTVSSWTSGVGRTFTMTYTAATNTFTWKVGNGTTMSRVITAPVGKEFVGLRFDVKSVTQAGRNPNVLDLTNISYTDASGTTALANASSSGGNVVGPNYYFTDINTDFTLTGTATWTRPANAAGFTDDRVTFSVRGLAAEYEAPAPVPEPATMAVLGIGALALMRRRSIKK